MHEHTGEDEQELGSESLRLLARALAPYLREELRRLDEHDAAGFDSDYDDSTCEVFVVALGDTVLERGLRLFGALADQGVIDSVALAGLLGVTPRELGGSLTTPLKRRAKALRLPLPFEGGRGDLAHGGISDPSPDMDPKRTHWIDRDSIATRMMIAIQTELDQRRARSEPVRRNRSAGKQRRSR